MTKKQLYAIHFLLATCDVCPLAIPESFAQNIGLRLLANHPLAILKAGLHAAICQSDLSARQCWCANRTCILTPDLRPIRENENRPDSENLLHCNRFLRSRADTFKEAGMSIKMLSKKHAYKTEAIKMTEKKTLTGPTLRSFQEKEISLLIAEWIKYPCLYDKGNKDYHDRNKREIARTHIAKSLNEQLGYDEVDSTEAITGKPETVSLWKY